MTIKEAAIENADNNHPFLSRPICIMLFEEGAMWMREELTRWINVEEELPPERVSVLTKTECDGEVRYEIDFVLGGKFMKKPAPRWWIQIEY